MLGMAWAVVGCDDVGEEGEMLAAPQFVDARPLPDLGGVDASPYFEPGPEIEHRCPGDPGGGAPEVYPMPTEFTFFDPPFYVRVVHLQNYGDAPLIIEDVRLDASPAFALYTSRPMAEDRTLVMTGGVSYINLPLCVPPDDTLMLFIHVDSIPGPLEDGWVFLETNRPNNPTICLPIWFGVNNPHEDCP